MTESRPAERVANAQNPPKQRISLLGSIPFISVHVGSFTIFWAGFSWTALGTCLALVFVRMFAITGGYHRYFSHRTYKTTRWFQFILAWMGASAAQMGPLWWAAHHRHHHRHSDTEADIHPPRKGFFWAHMGWIMCKDYLATNMRAVRDWARFPELRFLNKFHMIPPICLAVVLVIIGVLLQQFAPPLGATGFQMLAWGFFLSTVILYHLTFSINSLTHRFGRVRYETTDTSKNCFWLAVLTMGEGWHNNHHRYPSSERQGFYWWEIDLTHYILRVLSWFGLVWDLREPPQELLIEGKT